MTGIFNNYEGLAMDKNERLQYLKRAYPTSKPADKTLQLDDFATELDAIELAQFLKGEQNERG